MLLHVLDLPRSGATTDDEFAIQAMEWLAQLSTEFTAGRIHIETMVQRAHAAEEISVVLIGLAGRQLNRFRTILAPVDGTPVGSLALSSAVGLARGGNVQMHVLQLVVPVCEQTWTQYGVSGAADPPTSLTYRRAQVASFRASGA